MNEDNLMDAAAPPEVDEPVRNKRERISLAELYTVLEALLPFARTEVACLNDDALELVGDPDHAEVVQRHRRGQEAIESATRLIARKTPAIRRKQRAFSETARQADDASDAEESVPAGRMGGLLRPDHDT